MKDSTALKEKPEAKVGGVPIQVDKHPHFRSLQHDINRLFDDFTQGFEAWRPQWREPLFGDLHAKLDVKDNDSQVVVTAEIPGVEQKDIEVSVSPDALTIVAEKKQEKEEKEKGYYRMERSYGFFRRVMPLPCDIDRDNIEADYKNGVLKITMPKSKEHMKDIKKVNIRSAE